jgi:hypothetical protein
MRFHGNSNKNDKEHHLYGIYDEEENDLFKYGISDKPIDEDGYSSRMHEQVDYLNRAVGWFRFFAEVLIRGIIGKEKAREMEDQHVDEYRQEHGRNPRGNVNKTKRQREEE